MKRLYYILTAAIVVTAISSCKKDFMNVQPLDKYSDEAVWKDPSLIQSFINNIYLGIPHGFSNIMMSSMVDETMYNADFGSSNVTKSLITPSDLSIFDINFWTANRQREVNWIWVYKFVRSTNLFFEKIDGAPFDNPTDKNRMKGEVHFLRAYLYHNLVSMYGGVPIIKRTFGLTDEFNVPRDSYDNCIKFIVADLDSAANLLPLSHSGNNKGRATKGAALALKSRVLLEAASDLYNSNGSWAGSYANKELIGYVGGDRATRWQAAKDAAKAVIDLNQYSLYQPAPATTQEATKNYSNIFLSMETSEDIFVRYFTANIDENWDGYNPGLYQNPNGWHGWGSNTPTGQMVDAYEMADGSKFDWTNPAHKAAPYNNRDPRFYASINYDGAVWRPRNDNAAKVRDAVGIVQTGFYKKPDGSILAGLDTRNGPLEDWNGTYTGYYMRKFIDPTIEAQFIKQVQPWRYIRYTEILLNYAEACLGLGQETEAKQYINMIRRRAKMLDVTEAGQQLVDRYRNERRIELAFEDSRYFDVRRWMIAPQAYQDATQVEVVYPSDGNGNPTGTPVYNPTGWPSAKGSGNVAIAQQRAWNPRFYFLPIQVTEMNRNDKLIQNPLY
jgi:starch-binding outer membrane protein, SusD/RagB family